MLNLIVISVLASTEQICKMPFYGGGLPPPRTLGAVPSYWCNETADSGYCTKFVSQNGAIEKLIECVDGKERDCYSWASQICWTSDGGTKICEPDEYFMRCTSVKFGLCASWIEFPRTSIEFKCERYNEFGCILWDAGVDAGYLLTPEGIWANTPIHPTGDKLLSLLSCIIALLVCICY